MTDNLWAYAAEETEAANHEMLMWEARVATDDCGRLVMAASSASDFDNRLALVQGSVKALVDPAVWPALVAEWRKTALSPAGFKDWMHAVDQAVQSKVGLSVHDLPDADFRNWFDSGMEPEDAAIEAMAEAGYDDEEYGPPEPNPGSEYAERYTMGEPWQSSKKHAGDYPDNDDWEDELGPQGPEEEDITVTPTGSSGSQYAVGVVNGEYIGTFTEEDEVDEAIKAYMEKHQFYPNVWNVSDHGNAEIRTMSSKNPHPELGPHDDEDCQYCPGHYPLEGDDDDDE